MSIQSFCFWGVVWTLRICGVREVKVIEGMTEYTPHPFTRTIAWSRLSTLDRTEGALCFQLDPSVICRKISNMAAQWKRLLGIV
jgi:hypothetical protein